MTTFDIEYAEVKQLEELLQSVDRPGGFCAHGRVFVPMPKLEVEGVGILSFPVPDSQVRSLVETAERAPYGKGADTLVDTSVRDCWQIDAARMRLGGGVWADTLRGILDTVATGLGCPAGRLDAKLYKLLIYEPGGFFSAHRDTEKTDGMIATLSITLPAAASAGGELIVRHRDREARIDMNASEPSEVAFAAFYADCAHETLPIREGCRLSLVFNICLRPGDTETPRQAPDYSDQVRDIAEHLIAWRDGAHGPDKLIWLLEHEYSEAGLSFDALKNADAALGEVLNLAAERADCELHASIVHIEEHGSASYIDGSYLDEWDQRGDDTDDVEMDEVFEGRYWLDGWTSGDGARPAFGELSVNPGELLPRRALDDAEPDEQWVNESSGNAGVTLERAYRHAAFVIWPHRATLDILAGENIDGAVDWARRQVERGAVEAGDLIARLISVWPVERPGRNGDARADMLRLLGRIGDATLAMRFLREVLLLRYDGSENESLPAVLRLADPGDIAEFLIDLVESRFLFHANATLALLLRLGESGESGESANFDWRDALGGSVRAALATLPSALSPRTQTRESTWPPAPSPKRIGDAEIRDLFTLAWRCGLAEEAETAAAVIATHPEAIAPQRAIPSALEAMSREEGLASGAAYLLLWRHAADSLLRRSAKPPEAPRDWVIESRIPCDCELCAALEAFCKHPVDRVCRFSVRAELRAHLHQQIERCRLDMSHVTERRGRPYTLVCTKNRTSYERRLAEYAKDIETMRSLTRFMPAGKRTESVEEQRRHLLEAVAAAG